ncbi:MAG: hypothetical protein WBM57_15560 [Woeseiaceae bacterium]
MERELNVSPAQSPTEKAIVDRMPLTQLNFSPLPHAPHLLVECTAAANRAVILTSFESQAGQVLTDQSTSNEGQEWVSGGNYSLNNMTGSNAK